MTPSRRDLLQWMGLTAAAAALPACRGATQVSLGPAFFTAEERLALGALANAVLPPDDQPGGAELGAVQFIEQLLTVFEQAGTPPLFAGGPYSGRTPFANADGTPSNEFPDNEFLTPLALDRVAEHAWRLILYGSDGVPAGGPNDALLGKVVGLRDQVRQGISRAVAAAPAPLHTLDPPTLAATFDNLDPAFQDLLVSLVPQAAFGPPEYGGNPGLAGWRMVHYEGDAQPLGYSQWVEATQSYRERPEAPLSTANPGGDPEPMDATTRDFIATVVLLAGGKEFA